MYIRVVIMHHNCTLSSYLKGRENGDGIIEMK
jgi:hypothetical protein